MTGAKPLDRELEVAEALAREAGALELGYFGSGIAVEYKGDEAYSMYYARTVGRSEPWPAVGMPSSAGTPNFGLSVWAFVGLARLLAAETPPELARAVALCSIAALVLYLPFYIGFQSQAGGFVPNIINPTRFSQWFVMFGGFAILLTAFLARLIYERRREELGWRVGVKFVLTAVVGVLAALIVA